MKTCQVVEAVLGVEAQTLQGHPLGKHGAACERIAIARRNRYASPVVHGVVELAFEVRQNRLYFPTEYSGRHPDSP